MTKECDGDVVEFTFVSGFDKRGHFGPDLTFEILICSEIIVNQLSFDAYFMLIAAWIHFCYALIYRCKLF